MSHSINDECLILKDVSIDRLLDNGDSSPRLHQINLVLAPGEWLNVAGVNGSGKSSLARLLAGLTIEGVQGSWSRGFAGNKPSPYVMQQPDAQLFAETPREEIRFALEWRGMPPHEIRQQTEEILTFTGLSAIGDAPWSHLSGGQRQLTAVAAASAGETPLLIFDEATSMLDEQSMVLVHELAKKLHRRGTAIVWVTQRLQEIESAARTVAMMDGSIVFDGKGGEFLYGAAGQVNYGPTPCQTCGLRLPYLSALALELGRLGKLQPPYPETMEEWDQALAQIEVVPR
ncbi:energy-coupling factor ABC transporter ATP-binding protein [Paenibacillus sp. CF384]|uniref:energy-coupling factor ABC transporter ATP-binding protein n=1 Tax=Paenibacillus sp. CF384 TaxID=1884382 RepID=UPI0008954F6C|nr:ABC transporter ATP-binding protein [Paenibacillus sp. CF384]SDX51416.1 energy-coupling factor transport system ATP-binding protein/energy-coupling factor transport system ATP-binding protein [Paenibacillus sp. CF384]